LLQATNQSGTNVCGGGQSTIEVVAVPKKMHNESVHGAKNNSEGDKRLLLSSITKTEYNPGNETNQNNVLIGDQTSQTTTVYYEGSS